MKHMGRLAPFVVAMIALGSMTTPAAADLEDELADVGGQIADLEDQLRAAGAQRSGLVAELLLSRDRLTTLAAALEEAHVHVADVRRQRRAALDVLETVRGQLSTARTNLARTVENVDATRADAENWVRRQYMAATGGELASVSLTADDLGDLSAAEAYLGRISYHTNATLDRYAALRNQQREQRDVIKRHERDAEAHARRLADLVSKAVEARATRAASVAAVDDELRHQRRLLRELDHEIEHFERELTGLEAEQERLERLLEEEQRVADEQPSTEEEEDEASDSGFVRPVPGRITSPFGPRRHPILDIVKMHTGIDMEAPLGQDIVAAAAGRVIHAGSYGGYGTTVIVDHGAGLATLYAHQSTLEVRYGDAVAAGQAIGQAGATGLATGPHLHFEVRLNGRPVDPAPYL